MFRELDHAMLRRLEKRIIVDLPTKEARKAMFKFHLPRVVVPTDGGLELRSDLDYDHLAEVTQRLDCTNNPISLFLTNKIAQFTLLAYVGIIMQTALSNIFAYDT